MEHDTLALNHHGVHSSNFVTYTKHSPISTCNQKGREFREVDLQQNYYNLNQARLKLVHNRSLQDFGSSRAKMADDNFYNYKETTRTAKQTLAVKNWQLHF